MSEVYALAAGFVFGITACGLLLYYWLIRPMARLLGWEDPALAPREDAT